MSSAVYVVLLFTLALHVVSSRPVTMTILFEPTGINLRNLSFYDNTFELFYHCMTQMWVKSCELISNSINGGIARNVTKIVTENATSPPNLSYFCCNFYSSNDSVLCQRSTSSSCDNDLCQSFRFLNSSSCNAKCVQIRWSGQVEKLSYDSTTDHIDDCSSSCTQTIPSLTSVTSLVTTPVAPKTALTDESTKSTTSGTGPTDRATEQKDNNEVGIIIGAVCGVLVLVIAIVISILFLKRRRRNETRRCQNQISSSRTDGALGKQKTSGGAHITFDSANTQGAATVLSDEESRNRHSVDLNSGYYTIDDLNVANRYLNVENRVPEHNKGAINLNSCDPDYEYAKNGIPDSIGVPGDEIYSMAFNSTRSDDNYSSAEHVDSLETSADNIEQKAVYSRLRDNITVITNPYNVLLKTKEDPKFRKPLPEPAFKKETNGHDAYDDGKIENNFSPTDTITRSSTDSSKSNTNSDSRLCSNTINEVSVNDIPEYSVVMKKKNLII